MRFLYATLLLFIGLFQPLQAQNALEQCQRQIQRGELGAALKSARAAVAKNESDPDAHFYLGRICARQGDLANADNELRLAQTYYTAKLRNTADNSPEYQEFSRGLALTHRWLGEMSDLVGKPDDAISFYDKAIAEFGALKIQPIQADIIGLKADVISDTGNLLSALDLYNQALNQAKIDKQAHPELIMGYAWLNFKMQRTDKALQLAEEAIKEADHLDDKAFYRMTQGYFLLRQVQEGKKSSQYVWDKYLLKGLNELRDSNDKVKPGYNRLYEAIGLRYAADVALADALASNNPQATHSLLMLAKQRYQRSYERALELGARQELDTCTPRIEEVDTYLDMGAQQVRSRFYGGIDIGSSGIKPSLVELQLGGNRKATPQIIPDGRSETDKTDDNWNVIEVAKDGIIPDAKIQQAVRAVRSQVSWMAKQSPNPEQITIAIAGSSSMSRFSNLDALRTALNSATQALNPHIEFIDSREELLYDVIGVVPDERRFNAILLDIGSANGRFGYLDTGRENLIIQNYELRYGTKTLDQRVRSLRQPGQNYTSVLDQVLLNDIDASVGKVVQRNAIRKRKFIYLTGGISWALTAFVHPESAEEPYVSLSREDIDRFFQMMARAENAYPDVDLGSVPGVALRSAQKDLADVKKNFTPSQLLAGAGLLKHLADDQLFAGKDIFFARNRGWSLGLAESTYAARR